MLNIVYTAVALVAFPLTWSGSSDDLGPRANEEVVHLTVQPTAAPRPALKYQLLPDIGELTPGNAAQNYLKCFMEQRNFFYSKESVADRARYRILPLSELPADKLRDYGRYALHQADWAARLDTVDWQSLPRVQAGALDPLPPELGPLQILATALHVRLRGELAGKRFDDALRTVKTMLALSRHLGEHSTEVANFLGLSIAHLTLGAIEEMVQQPGAPNLYWAFTDLPCPLVDIRKGVHGDRAQIAAELRALHSDMLMTEPEIEKVVSRLSGVFSYARAQAGRSPRSVRTGLRARLEDADQVRAARARLVDTGCSQELINCMPPLQILLVDARREYETERDERLKLLNLPLWQIEPITQRTKSEKAATGLFAELLPQIVKLRRAQVELERQIALLRHAEAIRLYAADHEGKPPAKLSEISVPLPPDPVTGKDFAYAVEGANAHIRGSGAGNPVHYQVTLSPGTASRSVTARAAQ
jgi:hypothetical protein